jgi:hypothetical protein
VAKRHQGKQSEQPDPASACGATLLRGLIPFALGGISNVIRRAHTVPLSQLWARLPTTHRLPALHALSRMVAQRLLVLLRPREVKDEHS